MTSKFTESVHNLGYATGETLHRLFLSTNDISECLPNLANFTRSSIDNKNSILSSLLPSSVPTTLSSLLELLLTLPNRYRIWWLDLLHSDPLHVIVETLLIVMCIALVVLQRRADWRFSQERKKGAPTEEDVEELLKEWKEKRKPLGGNRDKVIGGSSNTTADTPAAEVGTGLIVDKIEGGRIFFHGDSKVPHDDSSNCGSDRESINTIATTTATNKSKLPTSALNFATHDYLSTSSSQSLRSVATNSLAHYGCGSCGPRGFYGTIDAHLEAEEAMSNFLGTEGAILYSDGASSTTSTMAAFAKRGDLLIVDEGVNEALLVGITLSRANVRYFRHNDVKDLRHVLEKVAAQDVAFKRKPTDQRRFLIVEGVYRNWGTLAPLKEIVKLKEEFNYRLILDDSHGIGTLGPNGRGSLEHAGLKPMVHCEILTFSLENALGSVGGMTVGSEEVVDHQRLSGAGYCFSASAPPFLSKVCLASVRRLEGRMDDVSDLAGDAKDGDGESSEDDAVALNVDGMKVDELKVELKKRGLAVSGRKAELQQRLNDDLVININDSVPAQPQEKDLLGPPLLERLHENISNLYNTLTNSSHPHALKLRNRLSITSHPQSPILYLRLADQEATRRTQVEQTCILDKIAHHCLVEGEVAIVSTGGHVKKYLHLVPEPCLRIVAHAGQTQEDVELLVRALGEAVESLLMLAGVDEEEDDGNFEMD